MHNGFFISLVGNIKDERLVCMNKKLLAKLKDKKKLKKDLRKNE